MAEEETVAEQTDAEAEAEANEDAGAQDESLDDLLNQFDGDDQGSNTESEQSASSDNVDQVADRVAERLQAKQQETERFNGKKAEAIKIAKGDTDVDDETIWDMIEGRASRDPRLQKAWMTAKGPNDPAFQKVMKALGKDIQSKFGSRPDPGVTEAAEAFDTAVRGAQTSAPDADELPSQGELAAMSDYAREELVNRLVRAEK